jgi:hypothetical protein
MTMELFWADDVFGVGICKEDHAESARWRFEADPARVPEGAR